MQIENLYIYNFANVGRVVETFWNLERIQKYDNTEIQKVEVYPYYMITFFK